MSGALTPEEDARDSLESYNTAIQAIGEQVKAGAPVPAFLRSRRVGLQIPGERTRVSLTLPADLSQEDWIACGQLLAEVEGAVQWWIGDWWAFGEHRYGDRKALVERNDWRGPGFGACMNAGSVSRAYGTSLRNEVLSFEHHRLAMAAPVDERAFWLDRAAAEGLSSNQLRAAIAHEAAIQRTRDVELQAASLGKFVVLYADPPWRYEHQPMGSSSRSIENHYPTMANDEICALPVADLAHENSVLFLWATVPKLFECERVLDAWGFTYRTGRVWVKDKIGMGYYVRGRHELLLIAARGDLPVPAPENRPDSVIEAPRPDEHSAKPPTVYDDIDRMYPGVRKLELFQREARAGWLGWGNQAPETVA